MSSIVVRRVIKVVREITRFGLADAKRLVDRAPTVVSTGLSDHDARRVQAMLQAAGATARVATATSRRKFAQRRRQRRRPMSAPATPARAISASFR